ncbi:MAG: sensor histidine kinase [Deltaproteobacteria bacterium]|nr:sensor histidine kinase [Deltaproteobacteria bacterium]
MLIIGLWCSPVWCFADTLSVSPNGSSAIGHQVEFLEDPDGTLSIEQIISGQITEVSSGGDVYTWKKADSEVPNFGYSTSIFWGRLVLDFAEVGQGKRWLLENKWPHVDELTIVLASMDGVELDRQTAGLGTAYSQRRFRHRNIVFPVDVLAGEKVQLFIRIESGNALQFPLVFWERESFLVNDHDEQFVFGMFYGILLVMLLYNLFIYFGVRETSYLDYVLFIGSIALIQLDVNKFSFEYLWPESPWWSMRSVPILTSLAVVVSVRFVVNFLNADHFAPRMGKFLRGCAYLSVPGLVIPLFVPHKFAAIYCLGLGGVGAAGLLVTTAHVMRQGYQPAKFFLIAWGTFLSGAVVLILRNFGVLPVSFLTTYGLQIGIALGVLLLSFSLAARIRTMKEEKKRVEKEALRSQMEALQHAEESNRIKGEFLANISHELRTPLNALCNIPSALLRDYEDVPVWHCSACGSMFEGDRQGDSGETLTCPDCSYGGLAFTSRVICSGEHAEHQHFLQRLETQAAQLLHLIDDVLNFSDSGDDSVQLNCSKFKLTGFMTDILDHSNRRAHEKGISVSHNAVDWSGEFCADREKLAKVVTNILENGLKFTPEGGRVDIIWGQMVEEGRPVIRCEIRDTGIGIASVDHDMIFESFSQVNSSHTRTFGGAGLGLAVSRELLRLHDGQIWVESELGKGSRFIFTIPGDLPPS